MPALTEALDAPEAAAHAACPSGPFVPDTIPIGPDVRTYGPNRTPCRPVIWKLARGPANRVHGPATLPGWAGAEQVTHKRRRVPAKDVGDCMGGTK